MALNEDSQADRPSDAGPRRGETRGVRRWHLALLLIVLAASGLALGGGHWWVSRMRPVVQERRQRAVYHASRAADWQRMSRLSAQGEGIVSRQENWEQQRASALGMFGVDVGYDLSYPYFYHFEVDLHHVIPFSRSLEAYHNFYHSLEADRNDLTAICRDRAEYHERMQRKWSRASWWPWIHVDRDPPMPPVDYWVPFSDSF